MSIKFETNTNWSRFESWAINSKSPLATFLWNLHTLIWTSSVIDKVLQASKITPASNHTFNPAMISEIFQKCHFGNTWNHSSKITQIKTALTKKIQSLARIIQPASASVSLTGPEAIELIRAPFRSIFATVPNGQASADIICGQLLPKHNIESVTVIPTQSSIQFMIVLKNSESTTLAQQEQEQILSTLSSLQRIFMEPLLGSVHLQIAQKISGSIDLEHHQVTFKAQGLTGDAGGYFERSLVAIQQLPLNGKNKLRFCLAPFNNPDTHKIQDVRHDNFQKIFKDFSWPSDSLASPKPKPTPIVPRTTVLQEQSCLQRCVAATHTFATYLCRT